MGCHYRQNSAIVTFVNGASNFVYGAFVFIKAASVFVNGAFVFINGALVFVNGAFNFVNGAPIFFIIIFLMVPPIVLTWCLYLISIWDLCFCLWCLCFVHSSPFIDYIQF